MKWLIFVSIFFAMKVNSFEVPNAYKLVATEQGIPYEVFYSMILQESGKTSNGQYLPWPWTLNVAHKAYRYKTREEAEVALLNFMTYEKRIAVGLGQIYIPAHGHQFENIEALLSPKTNLTYAAKLLRDEFDRSFKKGKGNWWYAVGRYHHPSKEHFAREYRSLVFMKCRQLFKNCLRFGQIL